MTDPLNVTKVFRNKSALLLARLILLSSILLQNMMPMEYFQILYQPTGSKLNLQYGIHDQAKKWD